MPFRGRRIPARFRLRDDGGPGDVEAGSQFTVGRSGLEGGDEFVDQVGAQPVLNQPELKSRALSEGWSAGLPSHVEIRSYAGFAGLERACTTSSCVVETTTLSLLGTPISCPVAAAEASNVAGAIASRSSGSGIAKGSVGAE